MKSETEVSCPSESVGSRMSIQIPTFLPTDSVADVLAAISEKKWDAIETVYIVDTQKKAIGNVNIASISIDEESDKIEQFMQPLHVHMSPLDDQERATYIAIHENLSSIAVLDGQGVFLGCVTSQTITSIMHEEHIEDAMLAAGIHHDGANVFKLTAQRTSSVVKSRAPWLIFGLIMGLGLGLISSFFEETLKASIAVAYFIPVVAYIAASVGAQSGAITVRMLASMNIRPGVFLRNELLVGTLLGGILGVLGGAGAFMIAGSAEVAAAVGLALFTASAFATTLAAAVPIVLMRFGKDPALGSGPLATALQDIFSLVLYFSFAMILVS